MSGWYGILVAAGVATLACLAFAFQRIRARLGRARYQRYCADFHLHRERLEAKFFELAGNSGKPRGPALDGLLVRGRSHLRPSSPKR